MEIAFDTIIAINTCVKRAVHFILVIATTLITQRRKMRVHFFKKKKFVLPLSYVEGSLSYVEALIVL